MLRWCCRRPVMCSPLCPILVILVVTLWRPTTFAEAHRPQERACEAGEGGHCGLNTISSAGGGGGDDEKKQPHFPLVLFILAPLTRSAILEFKGHIEARQPKRVDIYSSSDSLRCGQVRVAGKPPPVGERLPSQVAGCKLLLKEYANDPKQYRNDFGDHLNQAWLADEWRMLMEYITELRKSVTVNVYIYPFELFNNPTMDAKLQAFEDPTTFKTFQNDSEPAKAWNDMGIIQKYWYLWGLSNYPIKRHSLPDLGVVMDFVLRHDDSTRDSSLSHFAEKAEWCVAPQYKGAPPPKAIPMVYLDMAKQTSKYCQSKGVLASVTDNVRVAIPQDAEKFESWLELYKKTLDEVFAFQPSKIGFYNKIADRAIAMDALIFQDGADADDFGSVLWLLKTLRFQYTRLIVTNRPANFRIHKFIKEGRKRTAVVEMNVSRFAKSAPKSRTCVLDEKDNYASVLNYYAVGEKLAEVGIAYPMMYSMKRGAEGKLLPFYEAQRSYVEDDSSLVEKHTLWRWNQWLERLTVLGVDISGDGGSRVTPVSHTVFPYTFYFYNQDAAYESPDFIVPYLTYAKREAGEANRDTIWSNLQYVFGMNGQDMQEAAELQDAADSGLQRSRATYQASIALQVTGFCVSSVFSFTM